MAKLETVSPQKLSPLTSNYSKDDISSEGEVLKVTKSSCKLHHFLASTSTHLFTS